MNKEFQKRIDKLPILLKQLSACKPYNRDTIPVIPKQGIYVFYEDSRAVYVGRTDRMRQRLLEHTRLSGTQYSATFAYRMASKRCSDSRVKIVGTRAMLVLDDGFEPFFTQAKLEVSKMQIRHVEVVDPIDQSLFELYATEVLKTPFNHFENH
jgi:hypothetical protein